MTQAATQPPTSGSSVTGISKIDEMYHAVKQRKNLIDQERANINDIRAQADQREQALKPQVDLQQAAIAELQAELKAGLA